MSGVATVASFHDPMEAQIVRAMLESAGIDATLADLNLITVDWPMSVALGGVRVQVPVADLEEAKKLVAAYHAGELEYGKDAPETLACGACGSTNIQTVVPAGQKALPRTLGAKRGWRWRTIRSCWTGDTRLRRTGVCPSSIRQAPKPSPSTTATSPAGRCSP